MTTPPAIRKSTDEQTREDIQMWLTPHLSNPYLRLRYAVMEMAQYIEDHLFDDEQILINQWIAHEEHQLSQDDVRAYFNGLAALLPQREPCNDQKANLYQQLFRTLVHDWEKISRKQAPPFTKILNRLRNWVAHGKMPQCIEETTLAYLFWLNCRCIFKFTDDYLLPQEKYLFPVFRSASNAEKLKIHQEALTCWKIQRDQLNELIQHFNAQHPDNPVQDTLALSPINPKSPLIKIADFARKHDDFNAQNGEWLWGCLFAFFWEAGEKQLVAIDDDNHYLTAMAHCLWQVQQNP